ncbi:flavin reductase family protein [Ancylobacter terrae]|uniref:flavin reductase family protein n=1 Tax=Ancylobacter sp. sgz301288 TaxID=3342077 RepID=UPI00385E5328
MMMTAIPATGAPAALEVDAGAFRTAMRELAAGVTVVTASGADGPRGLTATAVCSVSADPPTLLVCVNRATEGHAAIRAAGFFCVNVMAHEHRGLAEHFAGRSGLHGAERFAHGAWGRLVTGAPVLEDALVAFDCRVVETLERGTHTVFLGAVVATRAAAPERPALVWRGGAFHLAG